MALENTTGLINDIIDNTSRTSYVHVSKPHITGKRRRGRKERKQPIIQKTKPILYGLSKYKDLDTFVNNEVLPDDEYLDNCHLRVDGLVKFLQKTLPKECQPTEICKGGSIGKETTIKGSSEIHLTLMLDNDKYNFIDAVFKDIDKIITDIQNCLCDYKVLTKKSPKSIQIKVSCHSDHYHQMHIIPAYRLDVSLKAQRENIYQEMIDKSNEFKEFYSLSLSPLEIQFIKTKPEKLKKLIQLVVYWRDTCLKGIKQPSSLLLEIITIGQWEKASKPDDFDLKKGLLSVIYTITKYQNLAVECYEYYDRTFIESLTIKRDDENPYVISPVNPFCNLAAKYNQWPKLAKKAEEFLRKPVFGNCSSHLSDWEVY